MDDRATLARTLGGLDADERLTEDEATQLAGLLAGVERSEREALDASIDVTLRHLPRLVRVPARKILFG